MVGALILVLNRQIICRTLPSWFFSVILHCIKMRKGDSINFGFWGRSVDNFLQLCSAGPSRGEGSQSSYQWARGLWGPALCSVLKVHGRAWPKDRKRTLGPKPALNAPTAQRNWEGAKRFGQLEEHSYSLYRALWISHWLKGLILSMWNHFTPC